ncbi:hypothetical protein RHMOL_Rhmol12G0222100 [Rhododendron molle]|uniref:Uncharacterized protein n=1 Tax=Rhododendron molle TaxID=49168 RepID=A0ACC0LLA3_RHOML|nr:hypothetical protein RHMOL_Rhmol12G0222100 [Rhododendron molle]
MTEKKRRHDGEEENCWALHKAMKGLGMDDSTLIRVIVTRAEIDLQYKKAEYRKKHGKSLNVAVHSETSGLCKISFAEFQRFTHPEKGDGSLSFLVVGDWGRNGLYNQFEVAFQVRNLSFILFFGK